jgi:dsDNA-specific endonuclease/ATPase MutS2
MDFYVGDRVSFLNEALNGVVSRIIDNKQVEVTTSDGFGIPVLIKELVKIGDNPQKKSNSFNSINQADKNIANISGTVSVDYKPYLCFSRNSSKDNEIYILNNSPYAHFFALRIQKNGEWVLLYSGKVTKRSYVFIGNYQDKELDNFRNVSVDIINVDFSTKEHFPCKSQQLKIKVSKFFKESSYSKVPILEKSAMLIDISGEIIEALLPQEELKKSVEYIPEKKPLKALKIIGKIDLKQEKRNRSRGELDLHIEKLGIPFKGKSNGQIVQIQLDKAKVFIDQSILAGKREIVLVHGVGNGVLKKEIHKLLNSYYGIRFELADERNYGKGGTLVHLKG